MEARELEQAAAAHMMRIRLEEERLLKRHAGELEARCTRHAPHQPPTCTAAHSPEHARHGFSLTAGSAQENRGWAPGG